MARHQSNITDTVISINLKVFLVPRDCAPFSQHQESQPLVKSNYLNMHREVVSYSQPIRFIRLDSEHVLSESGLPELDLLRAKRNAASGDENAYR